MPARGGAAAQGVIDQRGDGRAVLDAGEAMREAPILERVGGGTAACFEVFENFDRGGDASGGMHVGLCGKGTGAPSFHTRRREAIAKF